MFMVIVLCFILINFAKANPILVQINTGQIEGLSTVNPISGKSYYSFKSIPYAQPPIGELRFQAPKELANWNGTLETKIDSPQCYQYPIGFEDCLYLNVFTTSLPHDKETNPSALMPVMFYIHGGAFIHGSSLMGNPDYLIDEHVVLVTINYRLNVFGFLNTGDKSAPGNAGLKDMIAALQWVHKNIEHFNGDLKQVTIFGHSAGAASVQYLMQTKLTKDLFHRAIALSGSTLNKWSFQKSPQEKAFKLGIALGLDTTNTTELIQYLINKTAAQVFNASINYTVMGDFNLFDASYFAPSLEFESPEAVFTENSYDSIRKNHIYTIPYMTGYVSNEGLIFKRAIFDLNAYKNNISLLVPNAFKSSQMEAAAKEIIEYFFKNDSISDLNTFVEYQGQELFIRGITKNVEMMKNNNNDVYFYKFSFDNNCSESCSVAHAEELQYIFNDYENETVEGTHIRKQMTKLFTNFAKTGNPTREDDKLLGIRWPTVTKDGNTKYLHISNKGLHIEENPDQEIYDFWETLFNKYTNPPYYTW